ncbi:3-methyl-2-oxobutanoate hydroxymethyltransferase [Paenibacillus pasadenensis]|uniref:3-methyl-2-oxobutanoate hydroxymethyltransferase n=1 Tax=Paenibacillus pasadenensis TaxID=217090 RepID=A0A2N5N5Q3_9BACL|nr:MULTISPECIES: 3-methyl-2-oxobutanoate hydroxymethyltransferase [Paenibacillus]PLT45686.1 3-methyl-2-oxobutanoate hydroxymethyltransferase [Paenibacillus pasadenensis]QGG56130.1 3-methyl-2-oxobutanoate hydroxymethyltransferase [Paenibacillus sp. B01]
MKQALTTTKLQRMKREGVPITMLTAYDYPSAKLAEEAGVDTLLVGDSLGNVVLGYDTTVPVTLEDMIYHARSVARGAANTFRIVDMPFMTARISREHTLQGAARLMQEGHAHSVKIEGGAEVAEHVKACVDAGIPVIGHIGLTPQSVHQMGGYKIQGKLEAEAARLLDDALALQQAGAYAVVLELVLGPLAEDISRRLDIPTIGIGAGAGCDGQVLVYHDVIQYASPYTPKKFVKTYADVGTQIREALGGFVEDVKARRFPTEEHTFGVSAAQPAAVYGGGSK